jgi:nitrate/TMAO reductase-like tetraheme cytochrome c subunit
MSKELITLGSSGKGLVILLLAVVIFLGVISFSMAKTSSTEYCISCHEMKIYKEELEKSSHALTKDKKAIECRDCHIPDSFGGRYLIVKTVLGMKDVMSHYLGDPENLNRREMQHIARRFVPDENCRACHQDLKKDTEDKVLSEIGRLSHEAYLGENGKTRRGCAGCHFNMAHLPDFDRKYHFNAEFAKKLPLKKEQ